ncbi:hypothetical protein FOA52_001336 [Chlamydomonas sp. UWO 241]|nr:hypothetical protein FOA52_001336 [Chlamydomonas sp. UWO 241]
MPEEDTFEAFRGGRRTIPGARRHQRWRGAAVFSGITLLLCAVVTLDVVIVASIDDAPVFVGHALPSLATMVEGLRNIYAVCTREMCKHLEQIQQNVESAGSTASPQLREALRRMHVVPEDVPGLFPFTLADVRSVRREAGFPVPPEGDKDWDAWIFQQLLKLYSPIALARVPNDDAGGAGVDTQGASEPTQPWPPALPNLLMADSDTVWVKPMSFLRAPDSGSGSGGSSSGGGGGGSGGGGSGGPTAPSSNSAAPMPQCWYSVASVSSGAFSGDAENGVEHIRNLPPLSVAVAGGHATAACVNVSLVPLPIQSRRGRLGDAFTAITHHSVFQHDVIVALLQGLEGACASGGGAGTGSSAWQQLAAVHPFLSEYELYLSFANQFFPERVALRSLPYANCGMPVVVPSGLVNPEWPRDYTHIHVTPQPVYITMHDNFPSNAICCVNTAGECAPEGAKLYTCSAPQDSNGTGGGEYGTEAECAAAGCCFRDAAPPGERCVQTACSTCGAGSSNVRHLRPAEVVAAVQRLHMCQRAVFPATPGAEELRHTGGALGSQGAGGTAAAAARTRIAGFASCVHNGTLPAMAA